MVARRRLPLRAAVSVLGVLVTSACGTATAGEPGLPITCAALNRDAAQQIGENLRRVPAEEAGADPGACFYSDGDLALTLTSTSVPFAEELAEARERARDPQSSGLRASTVLLLPGPGPQSYLEELEPPGDRGVTYVVWPRSTTSSWLLAFTGKGNRERRTQLVTLAQELAPRLA